ncbi:ABC transporter permease [Liberiplasma polymorphum]|uniref:ABC transporter permease n=1 Tax=Liberiplasma polymorphum TaxID=3374570 RepID=UPI0037756662
MIRYLFYRFLLMFLVLFIIVTFIHIMSTIFTIRQYTHAPYDLAFEFSIAYTRYIAYIKGIFTENYWGVIGSNDIPVWTFLVPHIKITLILNAIAFLIYVFLGIILGMIASLNKGKLTDKIIYLSTMIPGSIPHFFLVFILIIYLGVRMRVLPAQFPGFTDDMALNIKGMIIPLVALSFPPMFKFMNIVRGEFNETANDSYLIICKTKGLTNFQTTMRHRIKNSILPIIPELTPTFLYVLTGSFFIEIIYGIPGSARLLFRSLMQPVDEAYFVAINSTMAVSLTIFYAGMAMIFALIIDMIYFTVDPRIKIGSKKTETT